MAAKTQLSRQARLAMLVVGLVVLLPLVLLLGNCVASQSSEKFVPASGADYDEIVQVGDDTMLLARGSIASKVTQWVNTGNDAYMFELDPAIFSPGSASPSPDGSVRIARFAQLMRAKPALTANFFVSGSGAAGGQSISLLQARVEQVRNEVVAQGVAESRVESKRVRTPTDNRAAEDKRASITVILSMRKG